MSPPPPALQIWIAAENVSLAMGGEAILPYHYFRLLLMRGVDVHVVTHERSKTELQRLFPEELARIHFVRDTALQKLFFRAGSLLPRRLSEATFGLATQMITQRAQRRILDRFAGAGSVVHQPIPVAPRFPSALTHLRASLVIGPLNGGMDFPAAFQYLEPRGSRWLVLLARRLTDLAGLLFQGKRQASILLVANERTRAALPRAVRGTVTIMPENGVDLAQWDPPGLSVGSLRFLFIGRLVDWKALDIVLEALATTSDLELDVVGDGPMRGTWQRKAHELRLEKRVHFHGWQSQEFCAKLLQRSLALVLPSVYESGGAVVLEAMAAGKPVIAAAWGGPADYLDLTCGILIPPSSREALVEGFASAMQYLAANSEVCARLGSAGQKKVREHYDWERKIDEILDIYRSAASQTQV